MDIVNYKFKRMVGPSLQTCKEIKMQIYMEQNNSTRTYNIEMVYQVYMDW